MCYERGLAQTTTYAPLKITLTAQQNYRWLSDNISHMHLELSCCVGLMKSLGSCCSHCALSAVNSAEFLMCSVVTSTIDDADEETFRNISHAHKVFICHNVLSLRSLCIIINIKIRCEVHASGPLHQLNDYPWNQRCLIVAHIHFTTLSFAVFTFLYYVTFPVTISHK